MNRLLELAPDAIEILDDLGMDSCCGGTLTLTEAAEDAGVDFESVMSRLEKLLSE